MVVRLAMMRDAGEAQKRRAEALERELEDAKREIAELRPLATRTRRAEADAEAMRAELRVPRRVAARRRTLSALAVLAVLAGIGTLAFVQVSAARQEATARITTIASQLDAVRASHAEDERRLQARIDWLDQRVAVDDARAGELEARLASEQHIAETLRQQHTFVAFELEGRVTAGRSDLPPGTRCTVAISPSGAECRATVRCGEQELYPSPGDGGYVSCESAGNRLLRASDVNTTLFSGDPALAIDLEAGTVVIRDEPLSGGWSVTIDVAP